MAMNFNARMTLISRTEQQSASGYPTIVTTDGTTLGAAVRTISPTQGTANDQLPTEAAILQATTRQSATSRAIEEGQFVRIDGEFYEVFGIDKRDFNRYLITFNLRRVSEVV